MRHLVYTVLYAALLSMALAITTPANAVSVKVYEDRKARSDMQVYIMGVGAGYSWSNTAHKYKKAEVLYCEPENLSVNLDNLQDIIKAELAAKTYYDGTPRSKPYDSEDHIEFVLLRGLQRTFPCNDGK